MTKEKPVSQLGGGGAAIVEWQWISFKLTNISAFVRLRPRPCRRQAWCQRAASAAATKAQEKARKEAPPATQGGLSSATQQLISSSALARFGGFAVRHLLGFHYG